MRGVCSGAAACQAAGRRGALGAASRLQVQHVCWFSAMALPPSIMLLLLGPWLLTNQLQQPPAAAAQGASQRMLLDVHKWTTHACRVASKGCLAECSPTQLMQGSASKGHAKQL